MKTDILIENSLLVRNILSTLGFDYKLYLLNISFITVNELGDADLNALSDILTEHSIFHRILGDSEDNCIGGA